ncbi:MAG: hypothetical protein KUG77_18125 [Nannocystaceae bacterium]|nr:hypothetical protein [Nannocystaceae bacterium]
MNEQLGPCERRYLDAYVELKAHEDVGPPDALRERVVEAALGGARQQRAAPRPGRAAIPLAAVGLFAAVALTWWFAGAALVETTDDAPSQAPAVQTDADTTPFEAHAQPGARSRGGSVRPAAAELQKDATPTPDPETTASPRSDLTEPAATPPRTRRRRPARPPAERGAQRAPTAGPNTGLDPAEVALLHRARRLARNGDHMGARVQLAEHARRFPSSVLSLEREAERAVVDCRIDPTTADATVRAFTDRQPPAYLLRRVEIACDR